MSETDTSLSLSAFLITRNEEANLAACLESLQGLVAEVVVIDSDSLDRTREIANSYGARVFSREFAGYKDQKQFALERCTGDWVLSLDADERVSPELRDYLIMGGFMSGQHNGYQIRRRHKFLGQWLDHGGLYPDYKLRLFRKDAGEFVGNEVHERVEVQGSVSKLPFDLYHEPWPDIPSFVTKQLRYSEMSARIRSEQNHKPPGIAGLFLKPTFTFWHRYLIRGGFMDGFPGLVAAWGWSMATAYKYLRLKELASESEALPTQANREEVSPEPEPGGE